MVSGTHCRRGAGTVTRSAGHGGGIGRGGLNVRHGTTELLERAAAERGSARLAPSPDFPHARLLRGGAGEPSTSTALRGMRWRGSGDNGNGSLVTDTDDRCGRFVEVRSGSRRSVSGDGYAQRSV